MGLGALAQYSGNAIRMGEVGGAGLKRFLREKASLGLEIEQMVSYMSFGAADVNGNSVTLTLRPRIFLEINF